MFDGATSQLDDATVEAEDHHDVTPFFLRNQTTREVQPMEKSVFVPFDHYWDEEVLLFYNHNTDPLSPSRDLARFSQKYGIKRPLRPTLKHTYVPLAYIP
jgi:hypothetical protein